MNTFNPQSYKDILNLFPVITYDQFCQIDDLQVRRDIAAKNKLLRTDAYNRTMTWLKGSEKSQEQETYTLTFRRSPNREYLVVHGIRKILKELFEYPILQHELDFAADAYAAQGERGGNNKFDKSLWQKVIDEHDGRLPIKIRAVEDGTIIRPGEPVLSVEGPSEFAAIYEAIFLRAFYATTVATDAKFLADIIEDPERVAEFGNRAAQNEQAHMDAVEAVYVGSGIRKTSDDAAAIAYPFLKADGTTAHRYLACHTTEDEAFEKAIQKADRITLLVDLVDSYQGIEKIIALKKKYRSTGKFIGFRLDSGDLVDQTLYALRRLKEENMLDPKYDKIVVADISDFEKIMEIEMKVKEAGFNPKKFIAYGLGGLMIARNKTRDAVSAAFKLTETELFATGKFSSDEGKIAIPGTLDIEIRDLERVIVQTSEEVHGERLMKTLYENGKFLSSESDLQAIESARARASRRVADVLANPTRKSEQTLKLIETFRARVGKTAQAA